MCGGILVLYNKLTSGTYFARGEDEKREREYSEQQKDSNSQLTIIQVPQVQVLDISIIVVLRCIYSVVGMRRSTETLKSFVLERMKKVTKVFKRDVFMSPKSCQD